MFLCCNNNIEEPDLEIINDDNFDSDTVDVTSPLDLGFIYDDDLNDYEDISLQDILIDAAKRNNVEQIDELLNDGLDINELEMGWSALHWLVITTFQQISPNLIHYIDDPKAVPKYIINAINLLIDKGADVNVVGDMLETPLHHSANMGILDSCRILLQKGALVNIKDRFGWSPLHYAAASGEVNVARILILYGANIYEPIYNTFNNDEHINRTVPSLAYKHNKNKTLIRQLEKCSRGEYTYENWVISKKKKFINIVESNIYNGPTDMSRLIVDYWIDISREGWLRDVWDVFVKE